MYSKGLAFRVVVFILLITIVFSGCSSKESKHKIVFGGDDRFDLDSFEEYITMNSQKIKEQNDPWYSAECIRYAMENGTTDFDVSLIIKRIDQENLDRAAYFCVVDGYIPWFVVSPSIFEGSELETSEENALLASKLWSFRPDYSFEEVKQIISDYWTNNKYVDEVSFDMSAYPWGSGRTIELEEYINNTEGADTVTEVNIANTNDSNAVNSDDSEEGDCVSEASINSSFVFDPGFSSFRECESLDDVKKILGEPSEEYDNSLMYEGLKYENEDLSFSCYYDNGSECENKLIISAYITVADPNDEALNDAIDNLYSNYFDICKKETEMGETWVNSDSCEQVYKCSGVVYDDDYTEHIVIQLMYSHITEKETRAAKIQTRRVLSISEYNQSLFDLGIWRQCGEPDYYEETDGAYVFVYEDCECWWDMGISLGNDLNYEYPKGTLKFVQEPNYTTICWTPYDYKDEHMQEVVDAIKYEIMYLYGDPNDVTDATTCNNYFWANANEGYTVMFIEPNFRFLSQNHIDVNTLYNNMIFFKMIIRKQ